MNYRIWSFTKGNGLKTHRGLKTRKEAFLNHLKVCPQCQALVKAGAKVRDTVQELLQTTARTAVDVAHGYLVGQGYHEGLSGRIVEWQIVLPTGKVEEQSVHYDGESLALPLAIAIVSAYIGEPIPADTALTGAFDLLSGQKGLLFGVGGIPQKVNAALDAGIKRIYIPEINRNDLDLATEKEAERVYAEIVPVQTVAQVAKTI